MYRQINQTSFLLVVVGPFFPLMFVSILVFPVVVLAAPSLTANETISNASASTLPSFTFSGGAAVSNGTIPSVTLAGGADEVKASRTLSVGSMPTAFESIVMGDCTVSFDLDEGGGSEDTDCSDSFALVYVNNSDLSPRTTSELATVLRTLSGVTAGAHGAITVSGSGTNVIFTTTNTEASATAISFTDNTGGDITSSSSTTGVIGVAATVTIAITSPLAANATDRSVQVDSLGAIDLGTLALTAANVAGAIRTGITGAAGYAAKNYTVSGSGANITFTRKATGTSGNGSITINDDTYTSVNAAAATASGTITGAFVANASDTPVTIDGVVINLGSSALTTTQVAAAIAAATFTSGTSYVANGAYTVGSSGAGVTFTRSSTGTGGNNGLTVADGSYGARAQVVTFTPGSLDSSGATYLYVITLNGTDYSFESTTASAQTIVESLQTLVAADSATTCTEDNAAITCTADTPGTAFTYSTSVTKTAEAPASQDGSNTATSFSGHGSSGFSSGATNAFQNIFTSELTTPKSRIVIVDLKVEPPTVPFPIPPKTIPPQNPYVLLSSFNQFNKVFDLGVSDPEIARLQKWLSLYPTIYPERIISGNFGPLTREAVLRFQLTYGIVSSPNEAGAGVFGPRTKMLVNSFIEHWQNVNKK